MYKLVVALCLTVLSLSGCGFTVVPKPTASAIVDTLDNSISETRQGITVTARVQDLEVAPYRMVDNITSFHVTISNDSSQELSIPLDSFILFDEKGNQYRPIEPSAIQGLVSRDSQYLIPYPYVGYYYLEDAEKSGFFNTFDSSLPFYAENYPQDVYTQALPAGSILPHAKVSGLVYFVVDLALKNGVELRIYRPGTPATAPADFILPFSIEK
jgi:hypothetical protein